MFFFVYFLRQNLKTLISHFLFFLILFTNPDLLLAQSKGEIFECAKEYLYSKNYKRAIDEYSKIIELYPNDSIVYFERALAWGFLKDFPTAISDFNKQLQIDSTNIDAYFLRAEAKFNLKQYQEALIDFKKARILEPNNADVSFYAGICSLIEGNFSDASNYFNYAISKREINPEAYSGLAMECIINNKLSLANEYISKAIEFDSSFVDAIYLKAIVCSKESKNNEVIPLLFKVIELNPDFIFENKYDFYNGNFSIKDKKFLENSNLSKCLLNSKQDDLLNYTKILILLRDYHDALEILQTLNKMDASNSYYYLLKGYIYSKQKLKEESKNEYQNFIFHGGNSSLVNSLEYDF